MTLAPATIESQATELAVDAFDAFCQDIAGMFSVEMTGEHQGAAVESAATLQKRFKKLTAVNTVHSEGVMEGLFHLLFDQAGVFTLSGVVVMLPEDRIVENIKRGTVDDLGSMNDAIGEVGNLLVGSWDRVFRENMEGHGHFRQTGSFVGKPWDNPEEKIQLSSREELVCVGFEVTVDSYPSFSCAAVFPRSIFGGGAVPPETAAGPTPATGVQPQVPQAVAPLSEPVRPAVASRPPSEPSDEPTIAAIGEPGPPGYAETPNAQVQATATPEAPHGVQTAEARPANGGMVRQAIHQMTDSAQRPREAPTLRSMTALDIMHDRLVWAGPDDSIQQVHAQMQQQAVDYVLVGDEATLEGIVSSSTIAGAVSPYLRPCFAKWRRPLDDATLQIRVRWVMARPVYTVRAEACIDEIVRRMRQYRVRSLPVQDVKGRVVGIVTAWDVMQHVCNETQAAGIAGDSLVSSQPAGGVRDGVVR